VIHNAFIRDGLTLKAVGWAFGSFYAANWHPLTLLSHLLDYQLYGMNAGGHHLTSVILHGGNTLLLFLLLRLMTGAPWRSATVAFLFALHPLHVESVAWISCRKNVLSLFFFLLSWEAYRRYCQADTGRGTVAYIASLIAFLLSLMAKSTTLVLPLILVLYDFCFPEGGRRLRLKDKVPYAVATLVFALLSMHVQQHDFQGGIREPYHGGSPLATFYTMLPVFCLYLWRLVWPAGLSAIYDPPVHTAPDGVVIAAGLFLAAVAWGGHRLFKYDRRLGFWLLFFWIGLLPFAQIVPIYWLITDRYMNVSIIGAAVLAGAAAVWLRNRLGASSARILYLLLVFLIGALSIASFQRAGIWRNSLTLWSDAVAKQPDTIRVWEHYAEALKTFGMRDESRRAYERVLASKPTSDAALAGLGDIYTEEGELDKGLALLSRLLEVKPEHVIGWASFGTNHLKRGNYVEAEKAYKHAQLLQPEAWQVTILLGNLELERGNGREAAAYYRQVEDMNRGNAGTAYGLACTEAQAGHADAALAWLDKALQRGFNDYDKLQQDPQLSPLWQDPRFKFLLERHAP